MIFAHVKVYRYEATKGPKLRKTKQETKKKKKKKIDWHTPSAEETASANEGTITQEWAQHISARPVRKAPLLSMSDAHLGMSAGPRFSPIGKRCDGEIRLCA